MKAFDTYLEIVVGAKERAAKAAEYGELESDEVLLQTISEAVFILCCFGSFEEAEKANDLTVYLKKYIPKPALENGVSDAEGKNLEANAPSSETIQPSIVAMACRAVGVGLANWASSTPISEARNDIRAEAITYLERSIAPELGDKFNCSSIYTLSVLLAENRDLDSAIRFVESALAENGQSVSGIGQTDLTRKRDLVSLWHLLALLLSAKEEFEIAKQSCEAAFEQFPKALSSFASNDGAATTPSQDADDEANSTGLRHTLIDQLQDREKERIIEIRMTQLAFVELLEGPEVALNLSSQLIGLFTTLFPRLAGESEKGRKDTAHKKGQNQLAPPRSPTGTTRSKRGSVFGRRRKNTSPSPASAKEDQKQNIQVPRDEPQKYVNGEGANITNGIGQSDSRQQSDAGKYGGGSGVTDSDAIVEEDQQPESAKQPLRSVPHNLKGSGQPDPIHHSHQPPEQDIRLPISYRFYSPTGALTRFPITQSHRRALGIVVKIWLFIAGLYRRELLFEDSQEACDEASRQVDRAEALVASSNETSSKAFTSRGWAGRRSSDELRADVCAEQGFLAQAQSRPHEAIDLFEEALMRYPDHPKATIGLANLQLDIWEKKLPPEPQEPSLELDFSPFLSDAVLRDRVTDEQSTSSGDKEQLNGFNKSSSSSQTKEDEPKLLNRLAARERAYGLMSALTKLGSSWDNSDAWYTLGRAYEAGGQIEKLKEVLWWCIELEDRRPIRHWSNIGSGLYVL